ncbi:MAG: CZB domain-containing protein [Gammaproteobacteria bacterium]
MTNPGATDTIHVLTFAVGDSRCAVDIRRVLYLSEHGREIHRTPIRDTGLLGMVSNAGAYVPAYDLAALLGLKSAQISARELIDSLAQRETEHVDWIAALKHSIVTGEAFGKATDPHLCAFGRWYDSFTTNDEELREILAQFDEPHRRIHGLAGSLLEKRDRQGVDAAVEDLRIEEITTLTGLRKLFEMARDHLQGVLRPVNMLVAGDDGRPCMALVVDALETVEEFAPSVLKTGEAIGMQWPQVAHLSILGMLCADSRDYLWIEPALQRRTAA